MLEFEKKNEKLKQEQQALKASFETLSSQIDAARTAFFQLERECFRRETSFCLAEHSTCKLKISQIQQQGDREKTLSLIRWVSE